MPIDYEQLLNWPFQELEHEYTERDTIFYALAVGAGADPVDPRELRLVYEEGLEALPTLATVLAYPGFWLKDPATGVDWQRVLHVEQRLEIHRPLPPAGRVRARTRVERIVDRGEGRGAFISVGRELHDDATGDVLASVAATSLARGDGGFGGPAVTGELPQPVPEREPDLVVESATLPQAALLYRLNGDLNPLHADPAVAAAAGFDQPILHGLCTYGHAGRLLVHALCDGEPSRLRRLDVRFTAPVYPGEPLRTEIWREGDGEAAFRTSLPGRGAVALNNGYAVFG